MQDIDICDAEAPADPGRRGALKCLAWAGTGVVWTLAGGVASSALVTDAAAKTAGTLSFVQISDSHIGFTKPANPNPLGTLQETIAKIRALPTRPAFVIHTGDITHLAKPEQFDIAQQAFAQLGVPVWFTPGEHDMVDGSDPRPYVQAFAKQAKSDGWYSFDVGGVHFIALVNVVRLGDQGQGTLGADQIAWLKDDVAHLPSSTPIVVYAHFPLWGLYPQWGWGTADAGPAMAALRRFGSVTVLNGHIHQVQQSVEGNMTFHTARSTAYPQPQPGADQGPGPLAVPPEQLRSYIGLRSLSVKRGKGLLALTDTALSQG